MLLVKILQKNETKKFDWFNSNTHDSHGSLMAEYKFHKLGNTGSNPVCATN